MPKVILSALYFVLWWLSLLIVMPFGLKTQDESGFVVMGSVPSAPAQFRFWKKILLATIVAFFIWLVCVFLLKIFPNSIWYLTHAIIFDDSTS